MAPGGIEPPNDPARLNIPSRILQKRLRSPLKASREEGTMSRLREAWLCVLQDENGAEKTELITIERTANDFPPVIELTNGVRITCIKAVRTATSQGERAT